MKRRLLATLGCALAAACAAPTASPAAEPLLKDCQDGRVDGSFSLSEIRRARSDIPADVDQYTGCRDALNAALARALSQPPASGGGGGGPGRSTGAAPAGAPDRTRSTRGSRRGRRAPTAVGGASQPVGAPSPAPTPYLVPSDQRELDELAAARAAAARRPVAIGGERVAPGDLGITGASLRHDLPAPLVAALAMLALSTLAGLLPALRTRVRRRARAA